MRTEVVIPEPCYWSPALPFLYELRCEWSDGANDARELRLAIGLRRLEPRKKSLYWDGKRIVLRGLRVATVASSAVEEARAAEVALLVPHPTTQTCELADEHGLPLIADLRGGELEPQAVRSLALHPSVTMMLIDGHQIRPCKPGHLPRGTLIAAAMNPVRDGHVSAQQPPEWADVLAVEVEPGGRPPAWIDHARRPVIAIRGNGPYADFQIARAACDRLQAVLAPDFDLAGYFV
jgi:hypothetical protein